MKQETDVHDDVINRWWWEALSVLCSTNSIHVFL